MKSNRNIYMNHTTSVLPRPDNMYQRMVSVKSIVTLPKGRASESIQRNTKEKINQLVHGLSQDCVVFTKSAGAAVKQVLCRISWKENTNVYISPYEQNSVKQALGYLKQIFHLNIIEMPLVIGTLEIDIKLLEQFFKQYPPFCICVTHLSGVNGYILPVCQVVDMANKYQSITIVDGSWSLGLLPVDLRTLKVDFLIFSGGGYLYGPYNIGGYIRNSHVYMTPVTFERKELYEPDISVIAGLEVAMGFMDPFHGIKDDIKRMTDYFVDKLEKINQVILYQPGRREDYIGLVSFNIEGAYAKDVKQILHYKYGISVCSGYHCVPSIHKWVQDMAFRGTVRVSIGAFTRKEHVDRLLHAIEKIKENKEC